LVKEIGSEFWDIPVNEAENNIFPKYAQWFLSGRSALKAIIKRLKNQKNVAMPSWCCDSMVKPFADAGFDICFYPVYWENGLHRDFRWDCDVLFIMDYFGYTHGSVDLSDYRGIVIRDITHSLFSREYYDSDYYFGSLRKWCGVWTGGYAWAKDESKFLTENTDDYGYIAYRREAMEKKRSYISGTAGSDKGYLKIFNTAEECLENIGILSAAERDIQKAMRLDVDEMKKCRRNNAEILRNAFSNWLIFPDMKKEDCPMFVPVLVPDGKRDALRRFLIEREIYCPIHWPLSEYHKLSKSEMLIYQGELSLVCDQRYSVEDMNRIVETINEFWKVN